MLFIRPFRKEDRDRKNLGALVLLIFYSPFIPTAFGLLGYNAEKFTISDQQSAELGLKYSNNEICYPATLVVGDVDESIE